MIGVYCDGSSARLRSDLPEPSPRPGEVVLRVRAVGLCDTDQQLAAGYMDYQGILGHEFVGIRDNGDRVTSEINFSCHVCPTCLAGKPNHCPNRSVLGILGHDGAMAERVAVPERTLHAVPDEISDREAVFIEPLAAAFRITEQVPVEPDQEAAVVGDGKLGILCAWVLREQGAKVSLVGKHPEKLALAGEGIETRLLAEIEADRNRFPLVVESTGSISGLPTALALVQPTGTVVLKTTVARPHELDLAPVVVDEIRIVGSRCGPFPPAIRALKERKIDVRPLIGAEFRLDQAEEAFQEAGRPGAKKVLMMV